MFDKRPQTSTTAVEQEVDKQLFEGSIFIDTICKNLGTDPEVFDDAALLALRELEKGIKKHNAEPEKPIAEAVIFAARAHRTQRRISKELYISHPIYVAAAVAESGFDSTVIIAALCHDVIEDCSITRKQLKKKFGADVANLVEGVTKLDGLKYPTAEDAQAADAVKFMVAVAQDIRVLALKLADRLHNLRTASVLSTQRQQKLALESLTVFSPLAHRLGMEELRRELEDLAFAIWMPDQYEALASMVQNKVKDAEEISEKVTQALKKEAQNSGIKADTEYRIKHLYSLYKKHFTEKNINDLRDLIGVRLVVDDIETCYKVLGIVHNLFAPVPGRFKDFIAVPRSNGYRSLHTAIITQGYEVEIQIRTKQMDIESKFGIAAHYNYKQGKKIYKIQKQKKHYATVNDPELLDLAKKGARIEEFMEILAQELAPANEIVVLTPKGRPVVLPKDSCAIDFGYKIHTQIGNSCVGARVDGKLTPIRKPLKTGQVVEILTSKTSYPRLEWLASAKTTKARNSIRKYANGSEKDNHSVPYSLVQSLINELKLRGCDTALIDDEEFTEGLAKINQRDSFEDLLAAAWKGELDIGRLKGLPPKIENYNEGTSKSNAVSADLLGLPFKISKCCYPGPKDAVGGYVSSTRVISVHRIDCINYITLVQGLDKGQKNKAFVIDKKENELASVIVKSSDRTGLLKDLCAVFEDLSISLAEVNTEGRGAFVKVNLEFETSGREHMELLLEKLKQVPSVFEVYSKT